LKDDWLTFGHDYERSGSQPQNVGLTKSNLGKIRLRWKRSIGSAVYASPIAYVGNVIVVTLGEGTGHAAVYDFRASDGTMLWNRPLHGGVRATPSIDPSNDELFVSDRIQLPGPSYVYAIRLLDGSVAWERTIPGITHASPVVAGGRVYVGISGGDPPSCIDGGIIAFDEQTGKQVWRWEANPIPDGGGSVWGAIAYDGAHLIAGTGNTCTNTVPTANGAVALNLNGTVAWSFTAQRNAQEDEDTGGGVLLSGGHATFINKNGTLYSLGQGSGLLAWQTPLGASDFLGGFATPSTNGSMIVEGAGLFPNSPSVKNFDDDLPVHGRPNDVIAGNHSELKGLDGNGVVLWTDAMTNRITSDVTIVNGLVFAGLNQSIEALDLASGKVLWSHGTSNYFDGAPIVVPSGLYAADDGGTIYAFTLP
jgi:outer membrane protein assembly factor BamB